MRLSTLFVVYLVATAAAIATPFAIHGGEMVRRRMIPVNSETPLELAPTEHQAPRGVFNPIPSCQAPDGTEYYMDYRFSTGSETEDRRVFVDDITVQSCAVGKDGTLYLVGTSENENWFRAYSRSGRFKWSIPRDEYCSRPAVARNGNTYLICMPRTGNTQLTVYDSDGQLRWALPTGGFEWSPVAPAIGPDGTIYAYTGVQSAPAIIAVTPDGRNLWSTSVLSQVSQLEVSPNGTIVVNIPAGHASAFDPQGRELWRFYSGVRVNNGGLTVAADGTVYFAAGFLYALDQNGNTKWTFKSELTYTRGDYFDGSPIVSENGTIYAQSYYRQLYAVTPEGRKKWATNTTAPGLADLMLSSDGGLRTNWAWFVVSSGVATHGWPSPNGNAENTRSEEPE